MSYIRTLMIALLLIAVGKPFATAQDWPRFRGPQGQGHAISDDLPTHWSTTENIVWKRPVDGQGWSSPVIHDGKIYLTTAISRGDEGDLSLQLWILAATDGHVMTKVEVFSVDGETTPRIHGKNSHASPTPIVHHDRVYVHFGHEGTACLDLGGNIVWQNRELRYPPVHGNGGTPIITGKALIFSCDGAKDPFIVALDTRSGDVLWKIPRPTEATKKFSFSTPALITVDGQQQVISPGSDMVCALDPETGDEIWRVRYTGYSVIPKPVFAHGLVFVSTSFDRPNLLAIRPTGQGDVTDTHVVWTVDRAVPHTPSLLVVGDELYMISDRGIASCLDARTGEVHWQERIGGNFSASPLYANGRIYLQDEEGTTTVIDASKKFHEVSHSELGERTLASYAVADDAIFLRSDKHLFRIQER